VFFGDWVAILEARETRTAALNIVCTRTSQGEETTMSNITRRAVAAVVVTLAVLGVGASLSDHGVATIATAATSAPADGGTDGGGIDW
jgi:hypothetical protein